MYRLEYAPQWPYSIRIYFKNIFLGEIEPVRMHLGDCSLDEMLARRPQTREQYELVDRLVACANALLDEEDKLE